MSTIISTPNSVAFDKSTARLQVIMNFGALSAFLVLTLCAVIRATPVTEGQNGEDKKIKVNSQPCLLLSDKDLLAYKEIGCSVKYKNGGSNCAVVESCPEGAPTYEARLLRAWLLWKMYNSSSGQSEIPRNATVFSNASLAIAKDKQTENLTTEGSTVVAQVTSQRTTTVGFSSTQRRPTTMVRTTITPRAFFRTTTTTKPEVRRVEPGTPCLRYRQTALSMYRRMGCTVIPSIGCSVVANCPTDCRDAYGQHHQLGSSRWFEDDQMCSCDNIRAVRAFVPRTPRRGTPYPPFKNCVTYGCFVPELYDNIKPGEKITRHDGARCECKVGADPNVQDDAPPFHLSCGSGT